MTNEWRGVTASNNEWQQVITSDSEWQRMAGSGKTNENEWERIKQSDFKFHSETKASLVPEEFYSIFYAIYNYYIFNNIDHL